MLSYMVGGVAGDFARGHLNAILRGIGKDDWDDFALLVKNISDPPMRRIKTGYSSGI